MSGKKEKRVYIVWHTMVPPKKVILGVFKTPDRAQKYCENAASSGGTVWTDHKWNSDYTTYFLEDRPEKHVFEIDSWPVW